MCLALFQKHLPAPDLKRYARPGQPQEGVDLLGTDEDGRVCGIQCKLRNADKALTRAEVDAEVAKAKTFRPALQRYVIATTAKRDKELQRHVVAFTTDLRKQGLFSVELCFWDDILDLLNRHEDIQRMVYGIPFRYCFDPATDAMLNRPIDSRVSHATQASEVDSEPLVSKLAEQIVSPLMERIRSEGIGGVDMGGHGVDIRSLVIPVTFAPPPLVEHLCERKTTGDEIREALGQTSWLALRGESGTGKTQLARLVIRDHDGPTPWVRFRDLDIREAALRLEASLRSLYGTLGAPRNREPIDSLCTAIPDSTVMVLDDLPRFDAQDELGIRLVSIVQQLNGRNVRLVSTSPYPLADNLAEVLANRVLPFECPPFTVGDVAELLLAHDAPSELIQPGLLNVIHTLTQGHPVLVVAAARFLRQKEWKFTGEELDGLLSGQHTKEITRRTLDRLLDTVTDGRTLDLLYRLKLIAGAFSNEDVTAIASVSPSIDRSLERLHLVTGLWVEREADDRYSLSPLFGTVPGGTVDIVTQRGVHVAVGTRIVRQQVLDPWQAARAIRHFYAGGKANYAAWLLLRGLDAILEEGELGDATILLMIWGSSPIPTDVQPSLQVFLRAHQIEARSRFGLSTDFVLADLNRLVERLTEQESWALASIVAVAGRTISRLNPFFANRVCLRLIRSRTKWRTPDGKRLRLPPPEGHYPEAVLWLTIEALDTREELADWVNSVRQLDSGSRSKLFSDSVAEDACLQLANRYWIPEAEKSEGDRDWDRVLSGLDELVGVARQFGQAYLEACAVRAKVAILAEYKNDLPGAVKLAEATLANKHDDARARFLVRECVARAYVYQREYDKAREWFAKAFEDEIEGPKHAIVFALVNASRALGELDANEGLAYAERAVRVADTMPRHNAKVRVQMLGELAIARWLSGDLPGAFAAFDRAGDYLLTSDERDAYWKGLYMCFGHACGYIAGFAWTGKPPSANIAGDAWTPPERGFFLRDHAVAAELFEEDKSPALFIHLVRFADGVGSDLGADKWASRGLEASRQRNVPVTVGVFAGASVAGHIAEGEYESALNLEREHGRCTVASQYIVEHRRESSFRGFDVNEVFGEGGDSLREAAERYAAMTSMMLLAVELARRETKGDDDVPERIGRISRHIESFAAESACHEYWESTLQIFDRVFLKHEAPDKLLQFGNDEGDWLIRNLAYLGATLHPEIRIKDAVLAHITVFLSEPRVFGAIIGAQRVAFQSK